MGLVYSPTFTMKTPTKDLDFSKPFLETSLQSYKPPKTNPEYKPKRLAKNPIFREGLQNDLNIPCVTNVNS